VARNLVGCRLLNHSATYWIFRSGLPRGRQTQFGQVARSVTAQRSSSVTRRGSPARTSILVILPFPILSSSAIRRVISAPSAKSEVAISSRGCVSTSSRTSTKTAGTGHSKIGSQSGRLGHGSPKFTVWQSRTSICRDSESCNNLVADMGCLNLEKKLSSRANTGDCSLK